MPLELPQNFGKNIPPTHYGELEVLPAPPPQQDEALKATDGSEHYRDAQDFSFLAIAGYRGDHNFTPMAHILREAATPGAHTSAAPAEQASKQGIYSMGGFMVDESPDGLRLYAPKDIDTQNLLSFSVDHHRGVPHLMVLGRDHKRPNQTVALQHVMGSRGTGGGVSNPAIEKKLHGLQNTPVEKQLAQAGFELAESQDPSKQIYRYREQSPDEEAKRVEMLAVVAPDNRGGSRVESFHKLVSGHGIEDLVKRSHIVGTGTDYDSLKQQEVSTLRLSTGGITYTLNRLVGMPRDVKLLRELTDEELGIKPTEQRVESTGFVVGGVNNTELILRLPTITDMPIDYLIERMQPGVISEAGFLGPEDDLRATMARDNEVVLRAGFTHQALADILKKIPPLVGLVAGQPFKISGHMYRVESIVSQGAQESPFRDKLNGSNDYAITNVETGASVSVSTLGIKLGEHYGFYQGAGTSYRTAPEDIIRTFAHLYEPIDEAKLQAIIRDADQLLHKR